MVVSTLEWPMRSWTVRMAVPLSSRCVANEWLRQARANRRRQPMGGREGHVTECKTLTWHGLKSARQDAAHSRRDACPATIRKNFGDN